ncbi:MAG: 4Fe-4S binding protein [Desulfobacter sp.]|nr:4Fe-4S binding protein [Desulfobacter sp.]
MKNLSGDPKKDLPYKRLQQHLNAQPVGFPPSPKGSDIKLLKHIFTSQEARIAACLSHEPLSLETLFSRARHLVNTREALETCLTTMVKKGGIEYCLKNGQGCYGNTPLVVGMYELQAHRLTPEFIRDFKAYTSEKGYGISFLSTTLPQMRTIPINQTITPHLPMADFDDIQRLLETARPPFVILPCICRKKKAMLNEPCTQTDRTETCLAMGDIAQTLIKMEIGRKIPRQEAMEIVQLNQEEGLVLQPSNTQKIEFLCACCGCCCSMLSLQKELPLPLDFWASNFKVILDKDICVGCGKCADHCQTGALTIVLSKGQEKKRSEPILNPNRCIGCGHCVTACPANALSLAPRPSKSRPPADRKALNTIFLKDKTPWARIKVIGKLARAILMTGDIRLLKKTD